jgi:hypothetical protein
MSSFPAAVVAAGQVVRGMPTRETDLMELFQASIVQAIAAAAGCNVSVPLVDNGIDLDLTHELPDEDDVPLRVQLKAVTTGWNADRSRIRAKLSKKRYDKMRRVGPQLPQILVVMDLPSEQEDWIRIEDPHTIAQHLCYWVNLAGEPEFTGTGDVVTVSAPATNVFDDLTLCEIMARIRDSGSP